MAVTGITIRLSDGADHQFPDAKEIHSHLKDYVTSQINAAKTEIGQSITSAVNAAKNEINGKGYLTTHRQIKVNTTTVTANPITFKGSGSVSVSSADDGTITISGTDNNTNTSHSHAAGAGLTVSGTGGTSGTTTYSLKAASQSELGGAKIWLDGTTLYISTT